jgi:general secretion pathway protein E/type IV pilus assembly protein PilB
MGIEPFLVSSTVEGVIAQRLIRTICPQCKEEFKPRHEDLPLDFIAAMEKNNQETIWHGKGCRNCRQTGFRGRRGIFEMLVSGDFIKDLVQQRVNANKIRLEALKAGMITLRQDGWRKVLQGITTVDEVARVTAGDIVA